MTTLFVPTVPTVPTIYKGRIGDVSFSAKWGERNILRIDSPSRANSGDTPETDLTPDGVRGNCVPTPVGTWGQTPVRWDHE